MIIPSDKDNLWMLLIVLVFSSVAAYEDSSVANFLQLVQRNGRQAEWHNATTPDGYILSVFRIPPNPQLSPEFIKNRVIFLQHGLAESAACFVLSGTNASLAFLLSDAGYDVWLGNCRGNTYSRRHQNLSPEDQKFWNFGGDEFMTIDVPTMIDYVLDYSKQPSISYVGHSLGGAAGLALLSKRKDYNDKLDLVVLLSPVVYWQNQNIQRTIIATGIRFMKMLYPSGELELFSQNSMLSLFFQNICTMNSITIELCYRIVGFFYGENREQVTPEILKTWFDYYPAGTSARTLYFCLEVYDTGILQYYDYGNEEMNLQHYGQATSPRYDLSDVTVPVVLFEAQNDPFMRREDVKQVLSELINSEKVFHEIINHDKFSHIDFLVAKDSRVLVYDRLLEILREFHGEYQTCSNRMHSNNLSHSKICAIDNNDQCNNFM